MRFIIKPVLGVNEEELKQANVKTTELDYYLPSYLRAKTELKCNATSLICAKVIMTIIRLIVKIVLRPRQGKVGDLTPPEVDAVYNGLAWRYYWTHHFTTAGNDDKWRMNAAYAALSYAIKRQISPLILEICTGTGNTVLAMQKVFERWKLKAECIAFDYNLAMLKEAKKNIKPSKDFKISFARGDATNISEQTSVDFIRLEKKTIDIATQMFGIGGISEPFLVFREILKVLKEGGHYYLTDMHRPIQSQEGERPFLFLKWIKLPLLESICYEQVTVPLALNRLWGWRDTTTLFYLAGLTTITQDGEEYGFELLNFNFQVYPWWFRLPLVPVAEIILKKTKICSKEANKRKKILSACKILV